MWLVCGVDFQFIVGGILVTVEPVFESMLAVANERKLGVGPEVRAQTNVDVGPEKKSGATE